MAFQPDPRKRDIRSETGIAKKRRNNNKKELQRQQREMVFSSVPVQDP
jgi:hypothetical protein